MGGFNNPIIGGGGALVYPSIHSPNFVTKVSGWSINKDGSAEFDDVTIRGSLVGGDVLLYSPSEAADNLIYSESVGGGTDIYGNIYLPGTVAYGPAGGGFLAQSLLVTGAIATTAWWTASPHQSSGWSKIGQQQVSFGGVIEFTPGSGQIFSVNGKGVVGGNSASTGAEFEAQGQATADAIYIATADMPPAAAPSGVETWHSINTLGYSNLWADSGVNVAGQYRLISSPPRTLELIGDLTVGTVADGTLIATLGASYHPAHSQIIRVIVPNGTPTDPGNMRLVIAANGQITCDALAGLAAPNRIYFHDFISLDA